ncbi:MAG: phosphatase PAP2 family protein [Lewinella sp.]|nr:phosphatase PAP2 family protein [Lewinella sp.]
MSSFLATDQAVFEWINQACQQDWLDAVVPYWRDKVSWVPAYLVALGWLLWRYRRAGLLFVLLVGATVGTADAVSSHLIKPTVQRARPCHERALSPPARAFDGCGGGYSFPSSHATNHFALGVLLFLSWGRRWGRWRWLLIGWAASIALAQVYAGVHYPSDVTAGALLGSGLAVAAYAIYRRWPWRHITDFLPPQATA